MSIFIFISFTVACASMQSINFFSLFCLFYLSIYLSDLLFLHSIFLCRKSVFRAIIPVVRRRSSVSVSCISTDDTVETSRAMSRCQRMIDTQYTFRIFNVRNKRKKNENMTNLVQIRRKKRLEPNKYQVTTVPRSYFLLSFTEQRSTSGSKVTFLLSRCKMSAVGDEAHRQVSNDSIESFWIVLWISSHVFCVPGRSLGNCVV